MSQADQIQQLVIICHQIKHQGQQPSVGLLRSKAPFKVSVTQAIDAMKQFNGSQQAPSPSQPAPNESRIGELESKVAQMEAAIAILEKRLQALDGQNR